MGVQEKLKRKMMERFREGEVTRLQQIVSSGKVTGAEQLVSDTVEKLRAKVVLCEAQRDSHKVCSPLEHGSVKRLRGSPRCRSL